MEETLYVILVAIVFMAFLVGLAALILWIKDRGGWTGTIVKRVLGALSLFIGLTIAGILVYILYFTTEHIQWGSPTAMVLMIWLGAEWLFGSDPGHGNERIKRIVGALSLFIGLAIAVWIVYNLLHSTEHFQWGSAVCILMIWLGAKWLFESGPGLDNAYVDFGSPELQAAIQQARETLPHFIQQVSHGVDQAYVKFPFETDQGVTEHIWGHVHHYANGTFTVTLANEPFTQEGACNTYRYVSESDAEDWQIILPNGKIKGGYSIVGAFRYLENNGRRLSRKMLKQKSGLVDAQNH